MMAMMTSLMVCCATLLLINCNCVAALASSSAEQILLMTPKKGFDESEAGGSLSFHVCPGIDHGDAEVAVSDDEAKVRSFADVHTAAAAVREAIAGGVRGPVTVELCAGTHSLFSMLKLGPDDVAPLGTTWQGVSGTAFFDSGMLIKNWQVDPASGIWSAPIPTGTMSRQLWVNGIRAERAHSNPYNCSGGPAIPGDKSSGGPYGPCAATICQQYGGLKKLCGFTSSVPNSIQTATGYANVPSVLPAMSSKPLELWLPGTELVFGKGASGASWTEPRCPVASVQSTSATTVNVTMAEPCWTTAISKGSQSVRFPSDVENSLELLDKPGEWYGDFTAAKIYYMPLPGRRQTPQSAVAILGTQPSGGEGTAVEVLPGTSSLGFENIGFRFQTWIRPSTEKGFVDLQSGFFFAEPGYLIGVPGALAFHGVHNVSVVNCTFQHLGLSGIVADGGSQHIFVQNSSFEDTSGSAVALGGVTDPILPPAMQDGPFTISNNIISYTGNEYHGSAGIFGGYVASTTITQNTIANTSNGAVTIGWGWGANNTMSLNKVTYNHIIRSNTQLYDCGSIYTLSDQPRSEVAYNYIESQVLLFGSLYHDAKSAGFHTHHNVIVGGPMWLYLQWGPLGPVHDIIVEDNFHDQNVTGGCASPQHASTCPQNLTIRNNTLVTGGQWPEAALAIERSAGVQK